MFNQTKIATITIIYILFLTQNVLCKAETISFDDVLQQSITNSFDLKISDIDLRISKAGLKEARSEYYPNLRIGYNNEYSNTLNKKLQNATSIGGTFINDNTRFQNLIYAGATYNLFDFGARGKKALIAKKDILQNEYYYSQILRDLKLDVLSLYTDALIAHKETESQKQILKIYKLLFSAKERLYEAGISDKLNIMEEAVNIAKTVDKIDKSKHKLNNVLNQLSEYTFQQYDLDTIKIKDLLNLEQEIITPQNNQTENEELEADIDTLPAFKDNKIIESKIFETDVKQKIEELQSVNKKDLEVNKNILPTFDANNFIESKIYEAEVEKKQEELKLVKRERLPKIEIYSNYQFYGADKNNPAQSFTNLRSTNVSVGISAMMPLFDGFKNSAQQDKVKLEIEKLQVEKQKKLHEMKKKYDLLYQDAKLYKKDFDNQQNLLAEYQKQFNALERLSDNKLIQKTDLLIKKSELITQILNIEISLINTYASIKKLEYLSGDTE
ncbi:MAG: TolC family protein [Vampirovibrionia bacterium]